jgi:hypothetical protein
VSQRELDEAVAEIVSEKIDEKVIRESAGRVFRKLFDSAYIASERVEKIRGCADVQLLIPGYIGGTLSEARALLVEDHLLGCAACRRVLHPERNAVPTMESRPRQGATGRPRWAVYALAASLVIGIGLGVTGAMRGILPGQHKLEATVESVQGNLYRISEVGASLIAVGSIIRNADELRTAKGSGAILRLASGATLELAEHSDVTLTAAWHGTDVNLERGRAIVQADDSAQKMLFISTGDMVIPVHSAVLAVDHGTKGSRVSVARGSAQLERGDLRNTLFAGQQFATSHAVYNVPIASEFSWSQNAVQYSALLNELSTLQKNLESIPSPGLRYSSTLAQYLPANTIVYAAIPNLGSAITQAKQMFDARLAESEALRNWWQQQPISQNGQFDTLLNQISSVSSYLGDEIVLGFTASGDGRQSEPVFLAELRQPGLADYVKNNMPANSGVQIAEINQKIVVASSSAESVKEVTALAQSPTSSSFSGTPLFARVKEVYSGGAGYFVAADLEQIMGKSVTTTNARFLVLQRKDVAGTSQTRATLSFDGTRQGFASWLAAPGPVGSLDFVSPDASFATSVVMKNPQAMVQDLINYESNSDGGFAKELTGFESLAGVSVLNDIAAPLGSDATFAIDGPGLPTAAWKLAIEVNDPERLKLTLATLVDRFNQQAGQPAMPATAGKLQLTSHKMSGLDVYTLSSSQSAELSIAYTFVDGYFLAAASEGSLLSTIQNKRTGHTLAASATFRAKLPADSYLNFSAMLYHNVGNSLGQVADQLKSSNALTAQQQQTLSALIKGSGPGLICLYGESDRITAASSGSFLGFDLSTLAGIYQGKAVAPLIAGNSALFQSGAISKN